MFKDFQRESFDKSRSIKQTISHFFKILLFVSTSKCNEERKKKSKFTYIISGNSSHN